MGVNPVIKNIFSEKYREAFVKNLTLVKYQLTLKFKRCKAIILHKNLKVNLLITRVV